MFFVSQNKLFADAIPVTNELKITTSVKSEIIKIIDDLIAEAHVARENFSELKGIVRELSFAQKELAKAQKCAEKKVEDLSEEQTKTKWLWSWQLHKRKQNKKSAYLLKSLT